MKDPAAAEAPTELAFSCESRYPYMGPRSFAELLSQNCQRDTTGTARCPAWHPCDCEKSRQPAVRLAGRSGHVKHSRVPRARRGKTGSRRRPPRDAGDADEGRRQREEKPSRERSSGMQIATLPRAVRYASASRSSSTSRTNICQTSSFDHIW